MRVDSYGSLAMEGHDPIPAVLLGLNGDDPVTIPVEAVYPTIDRINAEQRILLGAPSYPV